MYFSKKFFLFVACYSALAIQIIAQEYSPVNIKTVGAMTFYELYTDLFSKNRLSTEYYAYKLLKDHPIAAKVSYVAAPWEHLLLSEKPLNVSNIAIEGECFTVCHSVIYEKIIPLLKQMGVKVLFTPHASSKIKSHDVLIVPFPHFPMNGTLPAQKKTSSILFLGQAIHTRSEKQFLQ